VWASPTALAIVAFATLSLPKELQRASALVPALQSNWLVMHVSVVMLAYATLMFGSVLCMAVLALSQPKDSPITALREAVVPALRGIANGFAPPPPQPVTSPQLPVNMASTGTEVESPNSSQTGPERMQVAMASGGGSVTVEFSSATTSSRVQLTEDDNLSLTLDDLAYRSLLLGFGFLTVGIISGAVWANEAWGNYWSWDPKETWALICWFVYAFYLHTRLQLGWDTRDSAKVGAFGFAVVWLCYIGVNLMGVGLHSYGFFLK
jgi:cytochrome c-type biogenesis protein CcsB